MKRIIVTGADGFIGKYVINKMITEKLDVIAIDRSFVDGNESEYKRITCDLTEKNEINDAIDAIKSADVMIHLASDITIPGTVRSVGNNIACMDNSLEIAKRIGVEHFVYLSSIPLIGRIEYTPIDEEHPVRPNTLYHWSKYLGEKMLEEYMDCFDVVSIVRIPSPIGVGMREDVFLSTVLKKMIQNDDIEVYGDGGRVQNYIDVRDIAESIYRVIRKKARGLYLIAGDSSISNMDLIKLCNETIDSESQVIKGIQDDPMENERWIISTNKAKSRIGDYIKHDLVESVRWIYEAMK